MSSHVSFAFRDLPTADLVMNAVYEGGRSGNHFRDDPLFRLVGGGNRGDLRYLGSLDPFAVRQCVLRSDMTDTDWPDRLDVETGQFIYHGDNRVPGGELHSAANKCNAMLRVLFSRLYYGVRDRIPPVLIFTKGTQGRDIIFRGLAVPGASTLEPSNALTVVWKTKDGIRFQNYRAVFTILNIPSIPRAWLTRIREGSFSATGAPTEWLAWQHSGIYRAARSGGIRE